MSVTVTPLMVVVLGVDVVGDGVGTTGSSIAVLVSATGAAVVDTYWLVLFKVTLVPSVRVTVSSGPVEPIVVLEAVSTLLTLTFSVGKMVWLRV